MILGVFVFLTMGCSQVNDLVNGNTASHSNAAANCNPNVDDKNSNTKAENSNASTEPTGTPKPPEVKAFESNLSGNWASDSERVVFSKDEIKFYDKSGSASPFLTWKYNAVDAKTVEITDEKGAKSTATMTFEDNNTTLKWKDKMGDFTYKREPAKP